LAKSTLSKVILFNRKRSGEASRMLVEDYNRVSCEQNKDILETLSDWEKDLCRKMKHIEVIGKKGRRVPILLTKEMQLNMATLHRFRSKSGITQKNVYFFALQNNNSLNSRRGSACLKCMVDECDVKKGELLTSTRLRKHVGTITQLFNLKDNELDLVASFLGHDIRIHREYYRLPESTLHMAKVSRVLLAAEKGSYKAFAGKSQIGRAHV
jgi:hypothetical protein